MRELVILSIIFFISLPAFANRKGLGVSIGNPTGLNGKYWLNNRAAVDGSLALSLGKHTNVSMHSDYLYHSPGALIFNDVHPLDVYYGVGGRMEFAEDVEIGVRVPIGLAHVLEEQSADVFVELAPVIEVITKTGLEVHMLLGARYYF